MTIPANQIVDVNPGVIGGGGNPLSLNGVILSQSLLVPTNGVLSFSSALAVSAFFGPSSTEYALAQTYFSGYANSTMKPGTLFIAPFNLASRAAWLQSGSLAAMTLTQLQALSGTLIVTVDGAQFTSSSINLSAVGSQTAAATSISAAFTGAGKPTCSWNAVNSTFTLTSGTTGASSSLTFATGTLAAGLNFTSATGAILSQGDVLDTEATAMASVIANTQNWVSYMTVWEPLIASKEAFAVWSNAQNQRYLYVAWDTDGQAIVQNSTTCFGVVAKTAAYNGVTCVSGDSAAATAAGTTLAAVLPQLAAFVMGTIASINYAETNGRITLACRSQSGFTPTCLSAVTAPILTANGYNFYGEYATANEQFEFFYNGQMPGEWLWIDTFVNQVYLNSQFQLALMAFLQSVGSIPYNQVGYSLVRAAMMDPINSGLNSGIIRTGVNLSSAQAAEVNNAAGKQVSNTLQNQGYYLQILDPGSQARANRQTPIINFFYTDGGSIQQINLASIDVM